MKSFSRKSVLLPVSFLLPAAVMAAVFAVCGFAPFGTRTMGVMDMSHQYISFLYSLRDILSGRASLLYLPSMCLGGNMLGVFAYYLVSPLNLLICLFPRAGLFQAVGVVYLLRVGLCGLTMCIYTGRRRGWSPRCLVASLSYAFMAYMIAYSFNYLWHDCVILLPLVALGIARLREESRPWLYIIALAAALALNFYIGYILCLFSVLFFLFEFFSVPKALSQDGRRTLLRFVLSSLAAGALAAVLLLPAFLSLRNGKASFDLSALTLTPRFTLPELLSKLYPAAFRYEEIMPEGLPHIFCGTVTAVLTILYFANRGVPARRRLLTGGLMLLLVVSFWISALDLIWHGLNVPSWYNYRYSFLLSFLMAASADRELAEFSEGTRPLHLLLPLAVIAAASVLTFAGRAYEYVTWHSALAAFLIAAAVCAALLLRLRSGAAGRAAVLLCAVVMLVHAGELAVSAGVSLRRLTSQATDAQNFAEYADAKAEAFALLPKGSEFVRTESPVSFSQNRCEPLLFGYDGISHYGSTLSQDSLDFLDRLGFDRYEDIWAQYGPGVTGAADTLLGVRYLVTDTLTKDYAVIAEAGGWTLAENRLALPAGWTADDALRGPVEGGDSFAYLNALYAAAAPEVGRSIFVAADAADPELENYTADGSRYTRVETDFAYLTYAVTVRTDGPLYAEFDIPDYPGVMLFADGVMRAWYATAQTNGTVYLGDYAAGDTVTVQLQASADITVEHAAFATEDADALTRCAEALAAGACPLTKISPSHYIGSFTTGEGDGLLVLTLPYDGSWHITLDGQRVSASRVLDCLTALDAAPGTHTVELRYIPAGLIPGAVISLLALAVCLAVYFRGRKRR